MNPKNIIVTLILAGFLALLQACNPAPVTQVASVSLETPTPTSALMPEVGIAYPSVGELPTPAPSYPAPSDTQGAILQQPQTVTLEDSGKLVQMHVGDRFLLNLGTDAYDWTPTIDDQTVLSRVKNILTIRGSQGLFEALKAGSTVLHATGDPLCAQAKPACKMPSRLFTVTVVVQ